MDIDYIKKQFCNYKCNAKDQKIDVNMKDSIWCTGCQEWIEGYFDTETFIGEDACKVCRIDDFIRELQDFGVLKRD